MLGDYTSKSLKRMMEGILDSYGRPLVKSQPHLSFTIGKLNENYMKKISLLEYNYTHQYCKPHLICSRLSEEAKKITADKFKQIEEESNSLNIEHLGTGKTRQFKNKFKKITPKEIADKCDKWFWDNMVIYLAEEDCYLIK